MVVLTFKLCYMVLVLPVSLYRWKFENPILYEPSLLFWDGSHVYF